MTAKSEMTKIHKYLFLGCVLHNDAVNFIGQEDIVGESNASLKVPLGMWDDRVAPTFAWVHVGSLLECGAAVAEGGQASGEGVKEGQESSAKLELNEINNYLQITF